MRVVPTGDEVPLLAGAVFDGGGWDSAVLSGRSVSMATDMAL